MDDRFALLFEPIQIGPVIAPNRFYQTRHCNGMGFRLPEEDLYPDLKPALADGRLDSLRVIGDAEASNTIARAVFGGHAAAREFDEPLDEGTPFRVERTLV
jgi:hypothetical protein